MGDKESMIEEYLVYASANQRNSRYIKNVFQQLLSDPEDLDYLENVLIQKVQRNPDNTLFIDLLIWVEIQRRNYYGAFLQARALDKRSGNPGTETMQIGRIALDNRAWDDAIEIYTYVINNYGKNSQYYTNARQNLIKSKEGKVTATYPVNLQEVFQLSNEYQSLYNEFGPTNVTLEALRNKARLNAFYLDNKEEAIFTLIELIETPRIPAQIRDEAKIDLGDIYLLKNEPWEATLLYSQVEKSNKYGLLGYEAKLRNARLNYFTGNFALAKSHLDILKKATTKEISNDAIELSVLIKNNTILDTTDQTMQEFANAQLLIYQNKNEEAIDAYKKLLQKIPDHSLTDEIYWELANLELKKGSYLASVDYLNRLLEDYQYDILADDAFFLKAEITEIYLENEQEASDLYREFITKFPGSMYAAESRKRFRLLRGDNIN